MNIFDIIILLLILVAVIIAIKCIKNNKGTCNCQGGSGCNGKCSGCVSKSKKD